MNRLLERLKQNIRIISLNIFCLVMVFSIFMITGCEEKTKLDKHEEFLRASECWYHYDEVSGKSEKIKFNEDSTLDWKCVCDKSKCRVHNYDAYKYNKENSIIKLYNNDNDNTMEIEVLNYSKYHLLLKFDNEIKNYTYSNTGINLANGEKYIAGYSGEFAILEGNTKKVKLGPFDYDGDEKYPANSMRTYKFSDDVKAYTLFTFKRIKDGKVVEDNVDYEEISIKEAAKHIEYGGHGFVWFNDDMQVRKILFYGDIVVEE